MKNFLIILAANIVPLAFIILAGYIIHLGRDGWGWCLFLALLTISSIKTE